MALVIMTGASGSGKTAIAEAVEMCKPSITVFRFDSVGIPSAEVMATFGEGHQPGGAWQRAMTSRWIERIAPCSPEASKFCLRDRCGSLSFAMHFMLQR